MSYEDAFLQAYQKHSDEIFRYCYYRVYDRERARDLVQETFTRVWRYSAEGKEIRNIRAFLYTTARNLIINESRKKKTESLDVLMEAGFEPGENTVEQQHIGIDAQRALEVMRQLDDDTQEIITLRFVEGLGPKEIASIIGASQNVVSVRIHRALKQLRKLL